MTNQEAYEQYQAKRAAGVKVIAHIRHPAQKVHGYFSSSGYYYRGKPVLESSTLCGADCGHADQKLRDIGTKVFQRWIASPECHVTLCPECVALVNAAGN